ncbi:MAG: hypothetical protein KA327_10810 [Pseudarcicella sp.]|nr:hypothetical protein [Pseudarcicella sp.]
MKLIKIAQIDNYFKLEMIRAKLLNLGIQCYVYDGQVPTHGINNYHIQVVESDVEVALQVIQSFEKTE